MTSVRERFLEALVESAIDYAIIAMDLDGLVISWNEGAHRILGWTEEEMLGLPATVFFTVEDRRAGIPQAEMQAALQQGRGSDERWHQKKDGSRFWANGEMMPLKDESGTVQGFIKILRDRTEQRNAAEAKRADAEFLRSVLASSGDCIKVLDFDANLLFMNESGRRAMEVSDFNKIEGCSWPDFWVGPGKAAAEAAVTAAQIGGTGHFQADALTMMTGTPRWWDVQVTPILGADGQPEKLLVVSRDITAMREAEERQRLLMQELAHRVKNTLAVVLGIASQTLRGNGSLPDMREALTARLLALALAHDVLMQGSWTEASLRALVEGAAKLHGHSDPSRLRIEGPDVTLGPQSALSFALVLHELATNAVKYGALSAADGHVAVRWWQEMGAEPMLRFRWQEADGPPVVAPDRQGFGTRLIERSLAQGVGAVVALTYPPTGVVFSLDAPLANLQQASAGQ